MEFVILLPLLFVLIFGIIDFGILMYNMTIITNASREGARFGIVSQETRKPKQDISDRITAYCSNRLIDLHSHNNLSITTNPVDPATASPRPKFGDDLVVTVSWGHDFLVLPNLAYFGLPNPFVITARTVMKYE